MGERVFHHPLICLTYTHSQSSRNCNCCTTNPIGLSVIIAKIIPQTPPAIRQPSNNLNQPPRIFQPHLQLLHHPPAQYVNPITTSSFKRVATYASHPSSAPFIPRQTASRLPLKAIFAPCSRLLRPTFRYNPLSFTLLQSLTGTYGKMPQATHALTPHFKGVSARGVGRG